MIKIIRRPLIWTYVLVFAWILFLLFSRANVWNIAYAKVFTLENAGYFLIGMCGIALIYYINARFGQPIEIALQKIVRFVVPVALLLLLAWQIYSCYGGYFRSGWDVVMIRNTVVLQHSGDYANLDNTYYSWFPNNLLLVWVFKVVASLAELVGIRNWEFFLVAFQCCIDVAAIALVYSVTYDFTRSRRVALLAFLMAYVFVGLSPWFIIAYSDATGFLFPILILRFYQLAKKTRHPVLREVWRVLLGGVSMAGFYIKPQILIVFIAVVGIEFCRVFGKEWKSRLADFGKQALCYAIGIVLFLMPYQAFIVPSLHFQRSEDTTVGWQHFLMMGLNTVSDGGWSGADYDFTQGFATNKERNRANLEEADNRLREMGVVGLLRHLCRKQLVNYGDGTFAWGVEGAFFDGDPEWARNGVTEFMHAFTRTDGAYYDWFLSSKQLLWVIVLFFQLFVFFYRRKTLSDSGDSIVLVMAFAVLGLTAFELVFEARARYLFCYAPVYVVLFSWGARNAYYAVRKCLSGFRDRE